jgi:hypothetical protein
VMRVRYVRQEPALRNGGIPITWRFLVVQRWVTAGKTALLRRPASLDHILKSLHHRAPSPHCHPERSRGTLCSAVRPDDAGSSVGGVAAASQQQIFRLQERTRKRVLPSAQIDNGMGSKMRNAQLCPTAVHAVCAASSNASGPTGRPVACTIQRSGVTSPIFAMRSNSGPIDPAFFICSSI